MVLKIDSILKSYGEKKILRSVNLACDKHKVTGILGRNGSGKSTLLQIISGNLSAEHKYVCADEQVLLKQSDIAKYLVYLPQDCSLPRNETVDTILKLSLDRIAYQKWSNTAPFNKLIDAKCKHLSNGEQRMLEICCVLANPAPYALLDEPFNGLSPLLRDEVSSLIKQSTATKGILITDHDYRNVLRVSDKLYGLTNGISKEIEQSKQLIQLGYLPTSELGLLD